MMLRWPHSWSWRASSFERHPFRPWEILTISQGSPPSDSHVVRAAEAGDLEGVPPNMSGEEQNPSPSSTVRTAPLPRRGSPRVHVGGNVDGDHPSIFRGESRRRYHFVRKRLGDDNRSDHLSPWRQEERDRSGG